MNITLAAIRNQFRRAESNGWTAFFEEAAARFRWFERQDLMAIASRETNMGGRELSPGVYEWLTRPGDGGNGFAGGSGFFPSVDDLVAIGQAPFWIDAHGARVPAVSAPEAGGGAPDPPHGTGSRVLRALADLALVVLGAGLLVVGAKLLVGAASRIAAHLGVSDLLIGLTVVAVGTSLPELAACVVAVVRGQRDLALGNAVGSNVFNIGAVLGLSSVVAPQGIEVSQAALRFDIPIMFAVALVLLPVALTKFVVARWEGAVLLGLYCAYIGYLVLAAVGHGTAGPHAAVALWFVVPLSALWLVLLVVSGAACGRQVVAVKQEDEVRILVRVPLDRNRLVGTLDRQ